MALSHAFFREQNSNRETGKLAFGLFCGGFHRAFAAIHDGGPEAAGELVRKLVGLVAAVDVDGLTGGIDDDLAMVAGGKVLFDLGEKVGFDLTVEVVR